MNPDQAPAPVIRDGYGVSDSGNSIPTDIQAVDLAEVNGVRYLRVWASGIPSYVTTLDTADIAGLEARPRQAHDFTAGHHTGEVGDQVAFGEDIGYRSTGCSDVPGSGYGYWPPGPACPTPQDWEAWFPLEPVEADEPVATGLGAIGLWVNGVAVFNWSDGQSWQGERVWWNLAPAAEAYDLDICPGHSAQGIYHHHSHPTCLAEQLGDDGSGHSPIYGFASDGVPIAGPWVSDGTLARSSWRVRDYADPDSATGCGASGKRTCLLVDQTDPTLGTTPTALPGPDTGARVTSQSGNAFYADAGWFMQDWYFDSSLDDGSHAALDEHNGHVGPLPGLAEPTYHYHVTRAADSGNSSNTQGVTYTDAFPYYVGPTFWGELHDNALRGRGDGAGPGQGDGQAPPEGHLQAAADALGVTVPELQEALGPPPPDLEQAAEVLGVSLDLLRSLLPPPQGP